MQIVGLDIGYGFSKVAVLGRSEIFPSLAGRATKSTFGIGESDDLYVTIENKQYAIGETAIRFSRFDARFEDRNWIKSREWMALVHGALIKAEIRGPIFLVIGLPLSYYSDRKWVIETLLGKHVIEYDGRDSGQAHVEIRRVVVVPQPFGALCRQVFAPSGLIRREFADLLVERTGVIDLGSNHTNLLEVNGGRAVNARSDAIDMGGWDLCRAVRDTLLKTTESGDGLKDHELARAIEVGQYRHYGRLVSIEDIVKPIRDDLINEVCARATTLWGDGENLAALLVSGGLATVAGPAIRDFFSKHERVIIVDSPQMANARGFLAYGRFLNS